MTTNASLKVTTIIIPSWPQTWVWLDNSGTRQPRYDLTGHLKRKQNPTLSPKLSSWLCLGPSLTLLWMCLEIQQKDHTSRSGHWSRRYPISLSSTSPKKKNSLAMLADNQTTSWPKGLYVYRAYHDWYEWLPSINCRIIRKIDNQRTDCVWQHMFSFKSHLLRHFETELTGVTIWLISTYEGTRRLLTLRHLRTNNIRVIQKSPMNDQVPFILRYEPPTSRQSRLPLSLLCHFHNHYLFTGCAVDWTERLSRIKRRPPFVNLL